MNYADLRKKYGLGGSDEEKENGTAQGTVSNGTTYESLLNKYKRNHPNVVRTQRINLTTKFEGITKTLEPYQRKISNREYMTTDEVNEYVSLTQDLIKTGNNLYKEGYGLKPDVIQQWRNNAELLGSSAKNATDFYSQFDSEEGYTNWKNYYDSWGHYTTAEDLEEYAAKGAAVENPSWGASYGILGIGKKPVNNMVTFAEANIGDARTEVAGGALGRGVTEQANTVWYIDENMTDQEKQIYNYLVGKGEKEKADEYLKVLLDIWEDERQAKLLKSMYEFADEHPFWSSVVSVGTSVGSGFEYIGDVIDYAGDKIAGKDAKLDTNTLASVTNTIRGTVAEKVDWEIKNWDAFDFLYGTTMSAADSIAASAMFGNAGGVVLGLSAAAQGTNDALERGMSDGQAFWSGFFSGVFEGLFETVSIGNLNKLKNVSPGSIKAVCKNVGKSMLVNASEETLTEIANIAYDTMVNGEFANYTWDELKNGAWKNAMYQVIEAGGSGALMGIGMGGIGNAIGYSKGSKQAKKIYGSDPGEVVGEALEIDPDNAFAKRMQGRLDKGKNLSGGQLNRLVQQNEAALKKGDITTIQSAVEGRLTELGETGDVSAVAAALAKQAAGEKLSRSEQKMISESKYGNRVANELNPDNIKSEGYSTEWAEKLDTERINVEEYSRLVKDAELAGETTETTGGDVATDVPKAALLARDGSMPVGVPEDASVDTAAASDGQVTGKLTGKKSLQVDEAAVSADGQAEVGGNKVVLNGLRENADGTVVVATADDQTADPGDVKYPSSGHALVYQNYANIEAVTDNPVLANMAVDTRSMLARAYNPATGVKAEDYFFGSNLSYQYGFEGIPMNDKTVSGNPILNSITKEQRDLAYDLGRKAGRQAADTQDAGIHKAYEKAVEKLGGKGAAKAIAKKNPGKVVLRNGIVEDTMTEKQKAAYKLAKTVSKATGVTINIYRGMREHGKYNPATGEIWLNINSNISGSSMMAFTLAHELVHMAKQWKPADFKTFADYLFEQYGKKGVSVDALIRDQMTKAKENGYTLNEHEAYEEVIADACQRMLLDSDALQKMAAYKEKNPSNWQKIVNKIREFITSIRNLFKGAEPDSMEAALYKTLDEDAKQYLEKLFVDMVMGAGEHMSTIRNAFGKGTVVEVNADGEFTLAKGNVDGATKFLYNDSTWENGGRDTLEAALKAEGFSSEDINAALTIMDGKHKLVKDLAKQFPEQDRINQATITTDLKDGHSVLSALVSNGDYPVNIDLLMVCKKRKAYQRVINRLCETGLIQQATVDALAIAEINKILGKYGFETACLGCFVESRRLRIQEWANTIVKEWNSEVKKRNPNAKAFGFGKGEGKLTPDEVMQLIGELETGGEKNDQGNLNLGQGSAVKRMGVLLDKVPSLRKTLSVEDLITPDGLTALRKFDSNLFSMVKSRYGSNSPKFVQEFNPYNHELAKYGKVPSEYKSLREYLYAIGGARMQSFSDFIVENWFDYCQIVADLAARKLPMHTYTKEITLAKLFGQTGIKINMSLIPDIDRGLGKEYAGLTRNENGELELIWADKDRFKKTGGKSYMQSINFADAIALQNDPKYSANVGTIAVGVSDKHILMMLGDARIRMIIPYHSSGMNPIFADLMGTSYYKDYTNYQNTTVKQLYNSKGEPVSLKLDKTQTAKLTSGFQFNEVLQELGDARAAAKAYKKWCADASKHSITIKEETYTAELTPKFDDFSWHDNYYKLLEDFNTYDCISEEAAQQGDVQQIYPEDFDQILKGELTAQETHRQKQEKNQAFDKAMGEIETYLQNHTKADTVFYAEQHGVKLSDKDKKLSAEDKRKLAGLRKGEKYSMPKVHTDAIAKFGTTTDFEEAGFILPNGEMLKFTDDNHRGERQYDHRAIGMVYGVDVDLNVHRGYNKESNKHLDDFVEKGGIRFDPGNLEFNFDAMMQMSKNVPITTEQEQAIREFVEWKKQREEMYNPDDDPLSMYRGPLALRIDFGETSDVALSADRETLGIAQLSYEGGQINANRIIADIRHYYQTGETRKPSSVAKFRYSMPRVQAPAFYSQMDRVVDGMKQEKFGADSVVSMLRGRGVKAEEIKWSGIEEWLAGKKSVTKAELQEFITGSMLQIEEQMSGAATFVDEDGDTYTESEFKDRAYELADEQGYDAEDVTFEAFGVGMVAYIGNSMDENELLSAERMESSGRWEQYKLDGGDNYREIVFTLPNSSYSNQMMRLHWGEDAEGVLAHARIQDFDVNGKKMLFIEEIQSDYHNEGLQSGYADRKTDAEIDALRAAADERFFALEDYSTEMTGYAGEWETIEKTAKGAKLLREYREAQDAYDNAMNDFVKKVPDAPFKDTYHEYVLKRILRMAAEEGYDLIGWTPSYIQSERWSDEFAEAYRIEYDQDIPGFLKKYGKKWGATVGRTAIAKETVEGRERLLKETELENVKRDIESAKRDLARKYDSYEKAVIQRSIDSMEKTVATLEQELSASLSVWSMAITDAMKDSVLYEGQPKYSLPKVKPVQPSTSKWRRTLDTDEAKTRFPTLWDVSADESEVRNPTQISGTVKSYRKIYEYLKSEGFDGNILDASSGLGYGTRAGIEEYGFDVEDIEPYPDKNYSPKYTDYSALHKKYDVIISNAVLNVLPQDQRDALVVKMASLLKAGGRIFINVRGKDVDTLAGTKTNVNISPMEWFVGSTGSYQKGFTKPELVAYLEDALGNGYRVNPTSLFGAVSAVVTKVNPYEGKKLYEDRDVYNYDFMIAQDPMTVTTMPSLSTVKENGRVSPDKVVELGLENAKQLGREVAEGQYAVVNAYTNRDIIVGQHGLEHGLGGDDIYRLRTNARLSAIGGELVRNAIPINGLRNKNRQATGTYAMACLVNDNDSKTVAIITVEEHTSKVVDIGYVDITHAINGRFLGKKRDSRSSTREPRYGLDEAALATAISEISIADFLEIVNMTHRSILSDSVLQELGEERPANGHYTGEALFKTPNSHGMSPRQLLADAFDELVQTPDERELMDRYRKNITKVEEAQERLEELRGEISQLTKAKGDKGEIAALNREASELVDQIDKYDRELLKLEASKPLKDVLARARSAAYQKAKQRSEKNLKEYRQQVSERFSRGVEGRRKTEMRRKIRKTIRDLDKILNRGDKKRNVKEDMKDFVAEALSAAEVLFTDNYTNEDMIRNGFGVELSKEETRYMEEARGILDDMAKLPAGSYESWYERQEAEEKLKSRLAYRMGKLKDVFFRERQRLNKTEVAEVLSKLADSYAKLENSEYAYVNGAYHESVHAYLKMLQEDVGGAKVKDMTLGQLEELYKAYTMVLTTVQNANKMFSEDLKLSKEQLANRVMMEIHKAGGEHGLWSKGELARNQASWNNTKPIYAAERTGSPTFVKLVNGLFKGQYNWAVDMDEAKAYRQKVADKYGFKSWDMEKTYKFTSSSGIDFELNLNQIMALYAYAKREQAHDHLLKGGFVFGKNTEVVVTKNGIKRTYLNKSAKAHNISDEIMGEIIGKLTDKQKGFVDEMQDYLSTTMGNKGNEVSMRLYGVKLFMEKFYFPLRSAGQFKEKAKEAEMKQQQGQISIANSGFTHSTTPKASNPVVLDGFTDVWASHVNEMSLYHSMVLPMEDFRRVYNYASPNMEGQESASVNSFIENAYGDAATGYFDQLYKELNGGAIVDPRENIAKQRIGKFKKAAVMLSNSVWVQQFSAIGRAYALVDPKYFIGPKVDKKRHAALWEEVKQYAPVAIIKEMGGFDTHTGLSAKDYLLAEEYGRGERLKALVKDKQYRDEIMGLLPAKADELTWCSIWEAVKRETQAKNPKMDVKSEEFLKKAGERFSEVIEKTQVYDSVLARSANMRSKNALMQMLTAFMAEPTTTVNMIENALRKGNKKVIARTFGAVAASIVLNNALVSIIYAMRDDDEDETFLEKYSQAFTSGMLDDINPMTYYPVLKDIWSLFQGYDIERSDMAIYSDISDAVKKTVTQIAKYDSEMDEDEAAEYYKEIGSALMSILDAGAAAFGVPLKNVRRDLKSYYNTYETFTNGNSTTWNSFVDAVGGSAKDSTPIVGLLPGETKTDKLYDAIIDGDKEYVDRMKGGYKDTNAYNNAVKKALRDHDPRVKEAAQAQVDGDPSERIRIARLIIADGFPQDAVVMAINAEINALTPDDDSAPAKKVKGDYTTADFAREFANGDHASIKAAREDIIETAQENGKSQKEAEEDFASDARAEFRDLFVAGELTDSKAREALKTYCPAKDGPLDDNDIYWIIREWEYEKANGSSDGYRKYNDFHGAVETGRDLGAVISEYTSHGVKKETLASEITSHFKPLYREMSSSKRATFKKYLLNAYVQLGYDRSKKSKDIDKWLED